MKRISWTIAAALIVGLFPPFSSAHATEPTVITTEAQLLLIKTDDYTRAGTYTLGANIVLNIPPVGNYYLGNFTGTFNGNGFTISDLSAPLFRDVTGSVSNLNLITISAGISRLVTVTTAQESVGVLGSDLYGNVSGINVAGNINASGRRAVGGLFGKVIYGARVSNSSSSVSITTSRSNSIGGLVGELGGTIETSTSTGGVTTYGARYSTGGFVGDAAGSFSILSSASSGNVVAQTDGPNQNIWETGGFIGLVNGDQGLIKNSQALGSVIVTNSHGGDAGDVGGFVGYNDGGHNIQNVLASGDVTAAGWEYVGGLIGDSRGNVSNSVATGNVVGGRYVGGLFGHSEGGIKTNSRARGSVTCASDCGALIGSGPTQVSTPLSETTDFDVLNTGQTSAAWGQSQYINSGKPYILALIDRGFYQITTPPVAATEAEARAAVAQAVVKREAEVRTARQDIANKLASTQALTIDSFKQADIAGVTTENFAEVQAEILALPIKSRTDIKEVLKVARKFEVVGKIGSEQIVTLPISALVEVGLIPADSTNKMALTRAIKRAEPGERNSYAEIQTIIAKEVASITARKDRLAAVMARGKNR